MRWYGHHGAITIAHQHVVADPDRDLFAGQWMRHLKVSVHARLIHGGQIRFSDAALFAVGDEGGNGRVLCGGFLGQRVFWCDSDVGGTHDGVGTGGEHPQFFFLAVLRIRESKTHAHALADPVLLHQANLLRPAGEFIQIVQQLVGVFCDRHVVHGDFTLFDERA